MPDATAGSSVDRIPYSTAAASGKSRGSGYSSATVFRSGMPAPRAERGNHQRASITHRHKPAENRTCRETHMKPPRTVTRSAPVSLMTILLYVPSLGSPGVIGPRSNRRRSFGSDSVVVRQGWGGSRHERLAGDWNDGRSGNADSDVPVLATGQRGALRTPGEGDQAH
jgi:hypothetical protein